MESKDNEEKSSSTEQRAPRRSPTDSPLFWLPVFLVGALVALVLTSPKYRWRQPQIERIYQARELSGHAVSASGGPGELSHSGEAKLTLRPLFLFFGSALFLSTLCFWWWRFSGRHYFSTATQADSLSRLPDDGTPTKKDELTTEN